MPNFDDDSEFDQDKRLSDSHLDYSIYETHCTNSRGRGKMGAGSSSVVEVKVPDTRSIVDLIKVQGQSTPQMQGSMMDVVKELQQIECPTCQQLFHVTEIADHADTCCDIWVGEAASFDSDPLPCFSFELPQDSKEQPRIDGNTSLQIVLSNLAESSENPVRLNVRRKHTWSISRKQD